MKAIIRIIITLFVLGTIACKKDSPTPQRVKIYWGNAIYNPAEIIRDYSTYQSYPISLGNDVIALQPKMTEGLPSLSFDKMIVGDTCYLTGINKTFGLTYLYNITNKVKGVFVTNKLIHLDTCTWNNSILVRGSIKLNDDNSIDLEYTDSIKDNTNSINHYKVHYQKHNL